MPMVAPWHPAGFDVENWATIKWLAYGANVHSARLAKDRGYDDALLLGRGWGVDDDGPLGDRVVLDGPNFAVAWFQDGAFYAPAWKDLGMLESCTSHLALKAARAAGIPVHEGIHRLSKLWQADEVYILSTGNDLTPVSRVGDVDFPQSQDGSPNRTALLAAIDETGRRFESS